MNNGLVDFLKTFLQLKEDIKLTFACDFGNVFWKEIWINHGATFAPYKEINDGIWILKNWICQF